MTDEVNHPSGQSEICGCFRDPNQFLNVEKELGMDGHFSEVSLLNCSICGQKWLRVFYGIEAFTASGRWYLGAINLEEASNLTSMNAKNTLESLTWYFYGGCYFGGMSGKTSGKNYLD